MGVSKPSYTQWISILKAVAASYAVYWSLLWVLGVPWPLRFRGELDGLERTRERSDDVARQAYDQKLETSGIIRGDFRAKIADRCQSCEDFCYNWLNVNPVYVLKSQYCSSDFGLDPCVFYEPGKEYLQLAPGDEGDLHAAQSQRWKKASVGLWLEFEGLGCIAPICFDEVCTEINSPSQSDSRRRLLQNRPPDSPLVSEADRSIAAGGSEDRPQSQPSSSASPADPRPGRGLSACEVRSSMHSDPAEGAAEVDRRVVATPRMQQQGPADAEDTDLLRAYAPMQTSEPAMSERQDAATEAAEDVRPSPTSAQDADPSPAYAAVQTSEPAFSERQDAASEVADIQSLPSARPQMSAPEASEDAGPSPTDTDGASLPRAYAALQTSEPASSERQDAASEVPDIQSLPSSRPQLSVPEVLADAGPSPTDTEALHDSDPGSFERRKSSSEAPVETEDSERMLLSQDFPLGGALDALAGRFPQSQKDGFLGNQVQDQGKVTAQEEEDAFRDILEWEANVKDIPAQGACVVEGSFHTKSVGHMQKVWVMVVIARFMDAAAQGGGTPAGTAKVITNGLMAQPEEVRPPWTKGRSEAEICEIVTQSICEAVEASYVVKDYMDAERAKGRNFDDIYSEVGTWWFEGKAFS
ncbi:unnamed protein product [Symbiodinium pilosum]|uniref:Uncharacterized protein n=1 Tax=Symbiodinium pilosum TaxID=2952 RepID=A0A812X1G5_SYMPI|nr:unnamed protein product [Symbiodinium pilosum]